MLNVLRDVILQGRTFIVLMVFMVFMIFMTFMLFIYARAARACAYVRVDFGICACMGVRV